MTYTYTNRKNEKYYLNKMRNSNNYYFAKEEKNPVKNMPSGFEVREAPTGLPYLRRIN